MRHESASRRHSFSCPSLPSPHLPGIAAHPPLSSTSSSLERFLLGTPWRRTAYLADTFGRNQRHYIKVAAASSLQSRAVMSLVAPAPWSSSSHCAGHAQSAHTPPVINTHTHSYIYTAYILQVVSMQVALQVAGGRWQLRMRMRVRMRM